MNYLNQNQKTTMPHFKQNLNLYFELPSTKQLQRYDLKHKKVNQNAFNEHKPSIQTTNKTSICDQLLQLSRRSASHASYTIKNELTEEQLYKKKQKQEEYERNGLHNFMNSSLRMIKLREQTDRRSRMLMIEWETLNDKKLFDKRQTIE
ncbi:Hypothetical_protein [Hexamita inflata]|uniref:Hypothetical_protein n=1 Tax=Hexamita inflata TaxID=28002 RepID=A0AA86TQ83_9EUKA|nr:Hypothetical protein HINF_LOCUS11910 [Hexamita inflata]